MRRDHGQAHEVADSHPTNFDPLPSTFDKRGKKTDRDPRPKSVAYSLAMEALETIWKPPCL